MSDDHGHGGGGHGDSHGKKDSGHDDGHDSHKTPLQKYHFEEEYDEVEYQAYRIPTGYPETEGDGVYKYHLVYETTQQYIEEHYYWILNNLRYDFGYTHYDKITDVFAASEQSAFFGVSEQRLAMQQDRISQFLRGISEMLKSLFQLVREIRIIDERLTFYEDSFSRGEGAQGSEITLKGIWIDQVEGGVKNAGSVYGLSQTVGFTILPDLFFRIKIDDHDMHKTANTSDKTPDWEAMQNRAKSFPKMIDDKVAKLEFNEKVKEVLKRKLTQYYVWKVRTFKELTLRKRFTIKYLRQHYDTIKLYMGWIKPYLRNVRKMRMDQNKMDSFELVSAFEGSMVEVELLLSRQLPGAFFNPCVLLTFFFRTRPAMGYVGEGYQRGPTHIGKMDLTIRGYVWTIEQIQNYRNMRMEEDFELLTTIDESLKEAMDSLGDELKKYLLSEGEHFAQKPEAKKHDQKMPSMLDPFLAVVTGLNDVPNIISGISDIFPKKKDSSPTMTSPKSGNELAYTEKLYAKNLVKRSMWLTWKNFKKTQGMIQW